MSEKRKIWMAQLKEGEGQKEREGNREREGRREGGRALFLTFLFYSGP